MRGRWSGLVVAGLTGAVASVAPIAIAPTWLGLAVAGTATSGWCLFLEYEERASNRKTLKLVRERVTAGGTVCARQDVRGHAAGPRRGQSVGG
jgi:hypothetical protein